MTEQLVKTFEAEGSTVTIYHRPTASPHFAFLAKIDEESAFVIYNFTASSVEEVEAQALRHLRPVRRPRKARRAR